MPTSLGDRAAPRRLSRFLPALLCLSAPVAWLARGEAAPESEVGKLIGAIEATQSKLPRDRFDPAAIVAAANGEPAKLHAWVRAHTREIAYPGILRGPLGVLADRNGNDFDRALLLAHLTALAGYESRIVTGEVTDAAPRPGPASQPTSAPTPTELTQAADAITSMLLEKLGPLPNPPVAAHDRLHAWAQYHDGEKWVDLDAAHERVGERHGEPRGEPIPVDLAKRDTKALAKYAHTVTLRLVVERWEDGKLLESTLLAVPFDPLASPLAATTLTFAPVNVKASRAMQRAFENGPELRKKVLGEVAWTPILADGRNGGRMARMFDDAGRVGDLPKAFTGAGEVGNVTRDLFGGLAGGGEAEAPKSVLTALAADYLVQKPGVPARIVRRYVFDSIGPEARTRAGSEKVPRPTWDAEAKVARGMELAAVHDTLVTFASLPAETYLHRYAQRVIDSKAQALREEAGAKDAATLEVVSNGLSFRTLELFAVARDQELPPQLAITEPQILRRIVRPLANTNTTGIDTQVVSDLAWNRVAPVEASATTAQVVRQGVLDTLAEGIVVFRAGPAKPGDNTAALFAAAAQEKVPLLVLRDPNDPKLASLPEVARLRIQGDLASGHVVVAPERAILVDGTGRLGWWRVHPSSGHTIGVMDTGLLQDFVEYSETQEVNGITVTRFYRVRVPPEARRWAEQVIRQRPSTSWDQWLNLLRYATRAIQNGRGAML